MLNTDMRSPELEDLPWTDGPRFTPERQPQTAPSALCAPINKPFQHAMASSMPSHLIDNDLNRMAFEDVAYFAATCTMRLTQISDVLTAAETGGISKERLSTSAGMLAGLYRCINETQEQLRRIASARLEQAKPPRSMTVTQKLHDQTSGMDSALRRIMHQNDELCPISITGVGSDFAISFPSGPLHRYG